LKASTELETQATHYTLWAKKSSGSYVMLTKKLINESFRYLKKIFNPESLYLTFDNSTDYYSLVGLAALSNGSMNNLATRTISGIISLPTGTVAPAGGVKIKVYTNVYIDNGASRQVKQDITIPAGANSIGYCLSVPPNTIPTDGYKVKYSIIGTYTETYVMNGSSNPIDVSAANQTQNFTIQLGKVISGTIALPDNIKATTDLYFDITANTDGNSNYYNTSTQISTDQNAGQYSIVVPCGFGYKLVYYAYSSSAYNYLNTNGYLKQAYYNATAPTINYSDATVVNVPTGTSVPGINLTIMKGNKISGTVSLANNALAPTGGQSVNISASASNVSNSGYFTNVIIPAGNNSINYELTVAPGIYTVYVNGFNTTVDASSGPATANLTFTPYNSSGNWSNKSEGTIVQDWVYGGSLLVGNTVFAIDSPGFTADNVLSNLYPGAPVYYKDGDGKWFDLLNTGASDASYLTDANKVSANVLPTINNVYMADSSTPSNKILDFSCLDTYVIAKGSTPPATILNMTPPNTSLAITKSSTGTYSATCSSGTYASLCLTQSATPGPWTATITGNQIGTEQVSVQATAPGYPTMQKNIMIKVVSALVGGPSSVSVPTEINLTASETNCWSATDSIGVFVLNSSLVTKNVISNASVTGANQVKFTLTPQYGDGCYFIFIVKNGAPIAVTMIWIPT